MVKTLHFYGHLPELILKGTKNTTWRVDDDKDIKAGDELSLCRNDNTEFARAIVTSVKVTEFGKLTKSDREGHEEFSSDEEMYRTYSEYYKFEVKPTTRLKVIKFRRTDVQNAANR
jgi:hypothetical protein